MASGRLVFLKVNFVSAPPHPYYMYMHVSDVHSLPFGNGHHMHKCVS